MPSDEDIPASLFDVIPAAERTAIFRRLRRERFEAGATIIAEGDERKRIYVIESGRARISVADRDGLQRLDFLNLVGLRLRVLDLGPVLVLEQSGHLLLRVVLQHRDDGRHFRFHRPFRETLGAEPFAERDEVRAVEFLDVLLSAPADPAVDLRSLVLDGFWREVALRPQCVDVRVRRAPDSREARHRLGFAGALDSDGVPVSANSFSSAARLAVT